MAAVQKHVGWGAGPRAGQALVLAPQPTCFFTAATVVSWGRVARTMRVA